MICENSVAEERESEV